MILPTLLNGKHAVRLAATTDGRGSVQCALCVVLIQRTVAGSLADGVRAHYRTVHPERKLT